MRLQFLGCGDAFGSGGRFNTCFHVTGARANFLIDCGASSLIAMKTFGIDRNAIDTILVTHFHADHFGGLPFFVLDAQLVAKRTRPLLVAGPPELPVWYDKLFAATYPGDRKLPFELTLREVEIGKPNEIGGLRVTPYPVRHDERAGPCLAYRIEAEGKTICYSGDTEWTDTLIEAARGADLFICECYMFEKVVRAHLSLSVLRDKLPAIGAKRVILTHMSEDMLRRLGDAGYETAEDGRVVEF
ncbi:MAG: MBL fold metallo-hydrolase [Rhizobiales bacterium]|nr:MBL fold metallo-hydrolase [Hyphomicrobiales bacterium]